MNRRIRIIASAAATPTCPLPQDRMRDEYCEIMFGPDWRQRSDVADGVERITRLFTAAGVENRQVVMDPITYLTEPCSTADRMVEYERFSYPLASEALAACLAAARGVEAGCITDFLVVSCTGYTAPGLDILLARDMGMRPDVRRVVIGHMGCYGALVGLRSALASLRGPERGLVALLSVELSSLHCTPTMDIGAITSFALFGDAAAAVVLSADPDVEGPEVVDAYCVSDFSATDQMTWRITDEGFLMRLSQRVPVTLGRNVGPALQRLLAPHDLKVCDISHWLIHPGGPSILEAIQRKLHLSDENMALSWQVLRENGNCSSTTVLLLLDRLLRSGQARTGEWGVMMAFGPGLTLEMCLLRF